MRLTLLAWHLQTLDLMPWAFTVAHIVAQGVPLSQCSHLTRHISFARGMPYVWAVIPHSSFTILPPESD
jgi:hypothetical protein